jgi:secreted trypsin-like serine protease
MNDVVEPVHTRLIYRERRAQPPKGTGYGCAALFVLAVTVAGSGCDGPPDPVVEVRSPIIAGTPVVAGEHASVGALVSISSGPPYAPLCTGTLLDDSHVLTAAHCLATADAKDIGFVLSTDTESIGPGGILPARATYLHPQFTFSNTAPPLHDIGVLALARAAGVSYGVLPATPPSLAGQQLIIVGFGPSTRPLTTSYVETEGVASVVSVHDAEFTVGGGSSQPCFGDSGGPAFLPRGASFDVVGVASRAADREDSSCSQGAVYTSTAPYEPWLRQVVAADSVETAGDLQGCSVAPTGNPCVPSVAALVLGSLLLRRRRSVCIPQRLLQSSAPAPRCPSHD